ncbi:hypothetical protein PV10_05131 [Exophiala mesophila]|uniref:N-acetylglucosaminylphosphatidylinositol deacetylase n=1 Tax=Exophiala mesophila TaxID=212818 RepID=A0A0D1Y0E5_EXOME|nr:uncharacterized protein PV10_05131 [Exophiala mesophila]KIV93961.1 hypothetical protein PV10_05131 [Exophiala mesophila]
MAGALLLTLLLLPAVLFALWHLSATSVPPVPNSLRNKRIILLIAHPDDESMFFSPTLQALTHPSLQNHLKILCMSTGNADGLGDTRRLELETAALTLGLRRKEDVFVLDDERFKDGMKEDWQSDDIVRVLASAFAPHLNAPTAPASSTGSSGDKDKERRKSKSSKSSKLSPTSTSTATESTTTPATEGPRASIDVLITFDEAGVSSHPNHIALYHGARQFVQSIMKGHSGYTCPVALYTLPSVNIVRKYSFIMDALPTFLSGISGALTGGGSQDSSAKPVVFVNDIARYWKARDAMTSGHKSQMVWFRWGWIGLGRYMVVNDLRTVKIIAT